MYRLLKLALPL